MMAVGSDDAPGVGGWVSVRWDLGGGGGWGGLKRWRICEKGATADNHGRDEGRKCCELRPQKKKGRRGKESDYQYLQLDVGW